MPRLQALLRFGLTCLGVLVVANACFLAIRLVDGVISRQAIAGALRTGFERGALTTDPYPRNALQGRDRYSDCVTAQIAVVGDHGLWRNALTPGLLAKEQVGDDLQVNPRNPCLELKQYLGGALQPAAGATYARFWHGAASALKGALLVMPLDGYCALLLDAGLALIAATAVCAALAGRQLLVALLPLLILSFMWSGQVGYGQLVSYGPSTLAAWTVGLIMVVRRDRLTSHGLVALACAAGALEAFLDQMISVPLAASIFLIIAATVPILDHASRRLAGLAIAWWSGLAGTYATKLALATTVLWRHALDDFTHQLMFRAGTVDAEFGFDAAAQASRLAVVGRALLRLAINVWQLAYLDAPGIFCLVLILFGLLGWGLAAAHGFRAARAGAGGAFLADGGGYLAASLTVAIWILVFPEHALRHTFTVRAAAIWLIAGWGMACSARPLTERVRERSLPLLQLAVRTPE